MPFLLNSELKDFVEQQIAEERARSTNASSPADEPPSMTLFGSIGYSCHLRGDGSVWACEETDPRTAPWTYAWRPAGHRQALGAIKVAARRHPILIALLPQMPDPIPLCLTCHGSGHLTKGEHVFEGVWCQDCYGLGWLAPEAV